MNMKQVIMLICAAILGSAISLGTYSYFQNDAPVTIREISTPVQQVRYDGPVPTDAPNSFIEAARKGMPGVVHIKSSTTTSPTEAYQGIPEPFRDFFGERFFGPGTPQPRVGSGSGVIISADGYIVTNNHVVDKAEEIEVSLNDNRTFQATVVGVDPSTDLALIKIEATGLDAIPMVDSDQVQVGEWVLAIGNPFNLTSTVTAGIVSAKGRNINILKDQAPIESFIQTDAAVNPGNSGGALVNLDGGLIGINTAIASPTGSYSGYSFAVPSKIVRKVVEDLLKYGSVQRGYLGVIIRNVDGNLAQKERLDLTEGVYVDSLVANSAAKESGIKEGDVIVAVDNRPVKKSSELIAAIGTHRPGDRVEVMVNRKGQEKVIDVVLKNRNGEAEIAETGPKPEVFAKLGAEFEALSPKEAKDLNLSGGVRVKKLFPGKLRNATKMREGFIITSIDGQSIRKVEDLQKILANKKGGVMVEGVYEDQPGAFYYAFGM